MRTKPGSAISTNLNTSEKLIKIQYAGLHAQNSHLLRNLQFFAGKWHLVKLCLKIIVKKETYLFFLFKQGKVAIKNSIFRKIGQIFLNQYLKQKKELSKDVKNLTKINLEIQESFGQTQILYEKEKAINSNAANNSSLFLQQMVWSMKINPRNTKIVYTNNIFVANNAVITAAR